MGFFLLIYQQINPILSISFRFKHLKVNYA
jgi:hypothetical protein